MTIEQPILGWRTLEDMYEHYLAQTPSEEGTCAARVINEAEGRARVREVAVQVQTTLPAERLAQALASIKEDKDQANRLRAIVRHLMTRDAAAGVWFAIGRDPKSGEYEFIHPSHWNILLLNIEKGAVGRDPSLRFEDLRCAFTKDVPEGHPIRAAIRHAQQDAPDRRRNVSTVVPHLPNAPTLSPADSQEIARTGAPGRPTSMHLVEQEFERRCRESEVILSSLKAEAEHLAEWLKRNHPNAPRLTARTIENNIRDRYRKVKSASERPTK